MKLLVTADAVGGVWQYATDLAAALLPHGVEPVLAVTGPAPSPDQRDAVASGVRVVDTGLPLDWLAAGAEAVRAAGTGIAALAGELGADLVQLNGPALAGSTRFPCPVVAVAHGCVATWWDAAEGGALPVDLAWHAELMRDGLLAADAAVAPSASFADHVRRRYRLPRLPLVVHNGRTPPAPASDGPLAPHVLTAGRLWDRVKRTPLLDAVAARLPVPLRAAGPVEAPHGERAAASHLALLGTIAAADLAREYAARPVFVSAASFEPFGLAVLEAAQAGCALVLSDIATFRELWDGAALFVAGDDPAEWADAIGALVADRPRRLALGGAAAARARRYTPAATATAMAGLYAGLLDRRRAAA